MGRGAKRFGRGSGRIASPAQRERPPTEGRRVRESAHVAQPPCWKPCLPSPADADVVGPSPGDADVVGLSPMGRGAKRFGRGSGRIASPAQRERPTTEGRRVRESAHVAQPPCWKPCLPSPADADVVGLPDGERRSGTRSPPSPHHARRPRPRPQAAIAGAGESCVALSPAALIWPWA